ncbi:hypothetical protein MSAN_00601100 [Mycena sanguinolenta]|uniref:Uncharacterized protein n=1 Tax=Mycena sanguinolenta TaxID=230812 RepID=A0A8H7DIV5_9AGAR|nr:hypothetical protein MSAN_00601100 [Mycena sanguinolenta]
MRTPTFTALATLTALAQFAPCLATWSSGKAAQINFYTDTHCSAYTGEAAAWWETSPEVGVIGSTTGVARAQCITLNMPGNSQSINTAALWGYSTTTQPGADSGYCTFWDGYTCSGNAASSYYNVPSSYPTCQPARSSAGYLWKSAKCYLN